VVNAFFFSPPCDVLLSGMEKHSSSVSWKITAVYEWI
jgi:hypothetical protein